MNIKLGDIFLGNADGETEAESPNFVNLFYKNEKYDEIINNGRKYIVSGQKGTGKTLLAKYIEKTHNENPNSACRIVGKNEIELNKLIELNGQSDNSVVAAFYRWFLLNEIAKIILNSKCKFCDIKDKYIFTKIKKYCKYKSAKYEIKRVFRNRYPKGNYEKLSYQESNQKEGGFQLPVNIVETPMYNSCFSKTSQHTTKPFYKLIDELEKLVISCLNIMDVMLIVDDLDELGLKLDQNKTCIDNLLNLLYETKMLNDVFYNVSNSSKIIILIRKDILDTLNMYSSNLNKLLNDREVNLYWIAKSSSAPEKHPLMTMILNKIRVSNPGLKEMNDKELYTCLFPEYIDKKPILYYLLDYSFGRPREIINHLNMAKESNKDASYFSATALKSVRTSYSLNFKNELMNELYVHFETNYVNSILAILTDLNMKSFDFKEFNDYYIKYKKRYKGTKDARQIILDLYRFGVIGNSYNDSKAVHRTIWAYRMDGRIEPDFNKRFTIHYAMRKALGL